MMKLKPCPFCGETPETPKETCCYSLSWINKECGYTASVHCNNQCCFTLGKQVKKTEAAAIREAVRFWNKRA